MKIPADIQWLPLFDSIKDLRNQQTEFIERGGEDSGQQNEERFCFFIFGRFYSGDSESLYENLPEESIWDVNLEYPHGRNVWRHVCDHIRLAQRLKRNDDELKYKLVLKWISFKLPDKEGKALIS